MIRSMGQAYITSQRLLPSVRVLPSFRQPAPRTLMDRASTGGSRFASQGDTRTGSAASTAGPVFILVADKTVLVSRATTVGRAAVQTGRRPVGMVGRLKSYIVLVSLLSCIDRRIRESQTRRYSRILVCFAIWNLRPGYFLYSRTRFPRMDSSKEDL